MLISKKHVFWQSFLIAVIIFILGFILGIYLEQLRTDKMNFISYQSEIFLMDTFTQNNLIKSNLISCNYLIDSNIDFANKIYNEARQLEKYDSSNKITSSIKEVHKKYDLLRTILWINTIEIKQKCNKPNSVVYIYNYNTQNIEIKSKQITWSKILADLKVIEGNNIILIPIAGDSNITSLNYLLTSYNITSYPVVIINEKHVIRDLETKEDLIKYLNK